MIDTGHLSYRYCGDGHLIVWRRDGQDGITWDELQAVKNEALGPHFTCVELYPREAEVVNEANRRHLWVVPYWLGTPNLHDRQGWRNLLDL